MSEPIPGDQHLPGLDDLPDLDRLVDHDEPDDPALNPEPDPAEETP